MPLRSEIDPAGEAARPRTGSSWRPIFEGIHNAIVRHRIEPGARLAEEEIAEIYGVSRTVVRAALQALARDGVVILERNKGARVAQPSPEEAREIFEARAAIEPEIARRAAERRDAAGAARLRALIAAEHEALDADRRREAVFLSAEFHRVVAAVAGHGVLAEILNELLSRSSLVISLYGRQPDGLCRNEAHLALADALEGGEGEAAARLMREHVEALLAGLDLAPPTPRTSDLADALRPASDA